MGSVEEVQISKTWWKREVFQMRLWQPATTWCLHSTPFPALWRMEEILKAFGLANLVIGNILPGFILTAGKEACASSNPSPVLHIQPLIHMDQGMHLLGKRSFYLNDTFEEMLALKTDHCHQTITEEWEESQWHQSCLFCTTAICAEVTPCGSWTERKRQSSFCIAAGNILLQMCN